MDLGVSIITVCFNSEATIKRTIESVLNQSESPFEHIIVDGKSTDKTIDVINSYKKAYEAKGIKLTVISEQDEGYYDAMNKGVHKAEGELIGILNSDDWYEPDAIKNVKKAASELKTNDLAEDKQDPATTCDIYMGGIYIHNGEHIIRKNAGYRKYYQTSRQFNHPAMFATKKTYADVGDYINGNVHNDYRWYLKALKMGKEVCIIPEVLTNFSIGGVSSKKSFKNTLKRIGLKYEVYEKNGYSKLYMIECIGQELVKYLLVKG